MGGRPVRGSRERTTPGCSRHVPAAPGHSLSSPGCSWLLQESENGGASELGVQSLSNLSVFDDLWLWLLLVASGSQNLKMDGLQNPVPRVSQTYGF